MKILKRVSVALILVCVLGLSGLSVYAATTPTLGTATTFAILTNNLTRIGPQAKAITGDLGYATLTGSGASPTVSGTTYISPNATYTQAVAAKNIALTALNNQGCNTNLPANVDLATLNVGHGVGVYIPGVYCMATTPPSTATIGAAGITLSGNGTYIFRLSGSLTTAMNSHVSLQNSASACDVFWTTGLSAAISAFGGGSTFVGTLIEPMAVSISEYVTWTGRVFATSGGVSIAPFDHITVPTACTPPVDNLHVVKVVDNTYGGTAVPGDFNLHVKLAGVDVANSPAAGVAFPGKPYSLTPGAYVVSEDAHAGYTAAFSGDCDADGHVTLPSPQANSLNSMVASIGQVLAIAGSGKTCTVINHQNPPADTLHVVKVVDNAYGGTAVPGDFNLHVKLTTGVDVANSPAPGQSSPGKAYSLPANTYVVSEDSHAGYTVTYGGDCSVNGTVIVPLGPGKTACVVTNHQTPPLGSLRVIKIVDNSYGGTAIPSDFKVRVTLAGVDVSGSPAPGASSPGKTYSLAPNTYLVSEDSSTGYTSSYGGECSDTGKVVVPLNASITCIVTNHQNQPTATLHVIKKFYNDFGGTAVPSDAMVHVKNNGVDVANSPLAGAATPGTSYTLPAGTYTISEDAFPGYNAIYGNDDCDFGGNITLAPGANKTCTISNDQNPPPPGYLRVIKTVINNDGGTAGPANFNINVKLGGAQVSGSPAFGSSAPGVLYILAAGTYSVSEDAHSGYTQSFSSGCTGGTVSLAAGENKICIITNDDIPTTPTYAVLNVIKHVINDNGGTAVAANFTMHVAGTNVSSSSFPGAETITTVTLDAGTYSVTESGQSGYTETNSTDCSGTIAFGQTKTCTITNNDIEGVFTPATLHVIKKVINNDGGTAIPSDFNLYVKTAGSFGLINVTGSPAPGLATPGRSYTLTAGNYVVSEDAHSGYSASFSGDCDSSGNITLAAGGNGICTITNDDNQKPTPPLAFLHVIKTVINNNGGTATPANFTMNVKLGGAQVTGSPMPGLSTPGRLYTLNAGTYVVSENTFSGYTQSFSSDCTGGTVTLVAGDDKTCTITNDDNGTQEHPYAVLNVIKHVINDNGGTAAAASFTMHIAGTNVSSSSFPGTETITTVTLDAGAYSVTESGLSGYTETNSTDCSGTIAFGQTKTCTITNNDIASVFTPATLHVIKKVINDNGGTAIPSAFNLYVKLSGVNVGGSPAAGLGTPGRLYTLAAGTYTVSEDTHSGYAQSFSGDCDSSGNITLVSGGNGVCTITNDDYSKPVPPTAFLHVIKTVINNDGGTATPSSFTMNVKLGGVQVGGSPAAGAPAPGTLYTLNAGTYVVSENTHSGYTQSFSSDCVSGTVTLVAGDDKTCMITNDDIGPYKPPYTPPYLPPYTPPPYSPPPYTPPTSGGSSTTTTSDVNSSSISGTNSFLTTPKLPNTGVAPAEESTTWFVATSAGVLAVSFVLYLVKRKKTS